MYENAGSPRLFPLLYQNYFVWTKLHFAHTESKRGLYGLYHEYLGENWLW